MAQGASDTNQGRLNDPVGTIRIFLRYSPEGTPAISHLARISRPGRRVYRRAEEIQPVR